MFLTSIALRWAALGLTRYVQEPHARHTWDVVQELVSEMLDRLDIRLPLSEPDQTELAMTPATPDADAGAEAVPTSQQSHARVPAPKRLRKPRTRQSLPS